MAINELVEPVEQILYLGNSENMLLRGAGQIHISRSKGNSWMVDLASEKGHVDAIHQNPHHLQRIYLVISNNLWISSGDFRGISPGNAKLKQFWTDDKWEISTLGRDVLSFSEENSDWAIFLAQAKGCSAEKLGCSAAAMVTFDNGNNWEQLDTWVEQWYVKGTLTYKVYSQRERTSIPVDWVPSLFSALHIKTRTEANMRENKRT